MATPSKRLTEKRLKLLLQIEAKPASLRLTKDREVIVGHGWMDCVRLNGEYIEPYEFQLTAEGRRVLAAWRQSL